MLRRAMELVELVALRGEMSLRDIGAATRLPRSTAHRLVSHLVEVRLLESQRTPGGDLFALGPLIKELSGGQLFWRPLVQCARTELTGVRDQTGETVGLHVLYGERRVLVDQVVSEHPLRWVYGNHMIPVPLYAGATAKMLLALLPEEDMLRMAERGLQAAAAKGNARGPRALQQLVSDVEQIRARGHSSSCGEINPGNSGIAVPVILEAGPGRPLTVITLAGPSIRMTDEAMARHLKRLLGAAHVIGERLKQTVGETP